MPLIVRKWCLRMNIQQRYVMFILTFWALMICFLERQIFFKFVDEVNKIHTQELTSVSKCPIMISESDYELKYRSEFFWLPDQLKIVTQCFYIGFLIMLIPSGAVADMYGARVVMGVGVLLSSVTTLLSPTLSRAGASRQAYLMMTRFTQGLAQGLVIPATSVVLAHWAPATIRTTAFGIINSGIIFGWAFGYWQHELFYYKIAMAPKWEAPFYLSGVLGLVWAVLWFFLTGARCSCSLKPSSNRCITQAEVDFLHKRVEGIEFSHSRRINPKVPWKAILTSPSVLSLVSLNLGASWMHYLTLQYFEDYLINVVGLSYSLGNNVVTCAEISMIPTSIFWGVVGDWLIKKNYLSREANRKFFGFVSTVLSIPWLLCALAVNCNGLAAMTLYVVFCFFRSPYYSVVRANVVDLSPQHCGVLQAILCCATAICSLFITQFFEEMSGKQPSNINNWWRMFGTSSVLVLVVSLPYLWFGSAVTQPWNYHSPKPHPRTSQASQHATG